MTWPVHVLVGRLVDRSVIISSEGGKLHFHAPRSKCYMYRYITECFYTVKVEIKCVTLSKYRISVNHALAHHLTPDFHLALFKLVNFLLRLA